MKRLLMKVLSPFSIAWGRTPMAWKWKSPKNDLAQVKIAIAKQYHPGWHEPRYQALSNAMYFFALGAWPVRAVLIIIRQTRKHGAQAQKLSGRGQLRQMLDQLEIALVYRSSPELYYWYELWTAELRRTAPLFFLNNEMFALVGILNDAEPDDMVEDKLGFNRHLRDNGITVTEDLALLDNGAVTRLAGADFELPDYDFIVKPRSDLQGRGFACFERLDAGVYQDSDGQPITAEALLERLLKESNAGAKLLQPRLINHPVLKPLARRGFATARVLTGIDRNAEVVVIRGVFKMPLGDVYADNYHIGSIASPINLEDGSLGPATPENKLVVDFDTHPSTGGQITGTVLPHWEDAKALLQRAHMLLPQFVLLAWDIGFTAEGPVIVEANRDMGMELLQKPGRRPLGITELPALCRGRLERADETPRGGS